jgi:hypothetical protein
MSQDNILVAQVVLNFDFLCHVKTLFALSCVLPLFEATNSLIKYAQGREVFIFYLVAIVKISQVDLFMMYNDLVIDYQCEHFQVFCDVVENTFITINQIWITNFNIDTKNLAFDMASCNYPTYIFNINVGANQPTCRGFLHSIHYASERSICFEIMNMLISELERHFPNFELMNAMGIVFP